VGIVVVAATALCVILILIMGETTVPFLSDRYTIFIKLPNAPGVAVGTPVRKSGVRIGRVTEVKLLDGSEGVLLTAEIDGDRELTHAEVVRLNSESLLGDAVLEFVLGDERTQDVSVIEDGDYMEGQVGSNPLKVLVNLEDDMERALSKFNTAGDDVSQLARSLNNVVASNEEQIQRVIDKTETSMDKFSQAMTSINDLVGDPQLREDLRTSMENVPALVEESRMAVAEMRVEIQKVGQSLEGFGRVAEQAEKNLKDLEGLTEPLGRQGPQIVENLNSGVTSLNVLLTELAEFSQAVNNREGTLGRLAHDPDVYIKLNRTAGNLETASQRVDQIVDDVRVFTDKIARDPKQLGVAGALDRRTSGLKTPPLGFFGGREQRASWIMSEDTEIEEYRVGERPRSP
jgi:phospholipid/cholesterol/gamma-HCH transport system substrate-binding protein